MGNVVAERPGRRSWWRRGPCLAFATGLLLGAWCGPGESAGRKKQPKIRVAKAQELLDKRCALCHGKDGVAKPVVPEAPNLNDPEWRRTSSVEAIVALVKAGRGKMPAQGDSFTPEELEAVARYVLTLAGPTDP